MTVDERRRRKGKGKRRRLLCLGLKNVKGPWALSSTSVLALLSLREGPAPESELEPERDRLLLPIDPTPVLCSPLDGYAFALLSVGVDVNVDLPVYDVVLRLVNECGACALGDMVCGFFV